MLVRLTDEHEGPVTGATVKIEGNMSHPGMQPVFADATEVGGGQYRAPFAFGMAGDWVLTVTAVSPSGSRGSREVEVRGVRGR